MINHLINSIKEDYKSSYIGVVDHHTYVEFDWFKCVILPEYVKNNITYNISKYNKIYTVSFDYLILQNAKFKCSLFQSMVGYTLTFKNNITIYI